GGLPEGVDLVAVSTAADERRPNYPPAAWLDREGWTAPTLVDGDGAAATASGGSAFPFFVAVDGGGTVVARTSGELGADQPDAGRGGQPDFPAGARGRRRGLDGAGPRRRRREGGDRLGRVGVPVLRRRRRRGHGRGPHVRRTGHRPARRLRSDAGGWHVMTGD